MKELNQEEQTSQALEKQNKHIIHLEDDYPLHDRRAQGYKLIGFHGSARPKNYSLDPENYINPEYPYGAVPVWRYLGHDLGSKYDGAKLRELRAKNGVGNPKKITR